MHTTQVCSPGRLQSEEVIERRDAIGAAQRHPQRDGHVAQRLFVQIAEGFLHGVQSLDQPRDWFPSRRMVASTRRQRLSRLGAVGLEKSVIMNVFPVSPADFRPSSAGCAR